MMYVAALVSGIMAVILFPSAWRRIFWAWMVLLGAVSFWDYRQTEMVRSQIRTAIWTAEFECRFRDPNASETQALIATAKNLIASYPFFWWEGLEGEGGRRVLMESVFESNLNLAGCGYVSRWRSATLELRAIQEKALYRSGKAVIYSFPSNASIFIDEEAVAKSPATLDLSPGRYRLQIMKDGFQEFRQDLRVKPGKSVEVTAYLHRQGKSVK